MSKENKVYLSDLHFEHTQWNSELAFWKLEVQSFISRLEEVASRYTSTEMGAKVEHFQNQFILHSEVIDALVKEIKKHEKQIANQAMEHPVAIDHVYFEDHTSLRDKMETQRKIFGDLKTEYYSFLSKAM